MRLRMSSSILWRYSGGIFDIMVHLLLAIIYLAAISLGLPDSLLGSAWPTIQTELNAPLSGASLIYMIVTCGTITSSLMSERLTHRFGAGKVTAVSIGITAFAIFGNSISSEFWHLCVFAIPYGLGAGSIDAALNNYVATHYSSRYMSWFHALWGVGTIIGPYIFGYTLSIGQTWNDGYRWTSVIQTAIAVVVFLSLPLWKKQISSDASPEEDMGKPMTLKQTLRLPGAKEIFIAFFCYGALEQTAALWASSYMVLQCGIDTVRAAKYASMFYIGITIGRFISGFLTIRFTDRQMIRLGMAIAGCGVAAIFIPLGIGSALPGMMKVGGCRACEACFKAGKACSFDDDFNIIAPAILEADAVVFTMPVYWYTIPAQIKCVIDKLFSFCIAGKDTAGKECAVIACCEEKDMSVLDGVRIPIERTAALLKWKMIGEVLIPGVLNVGDIENTDGCEKSAALAEKI